MISYSMSYIVSQILRLIYENEKGLHHPEHASVGVI